MSITEPLEKHGLRREEAAKRLNIGVRTLDRYRAQGKITPNFIRAENGKSIAFYSEPDLVRLQDELRSEASAQELRRKQAQEKMRQRSARQVRFRLSPAHHEALLKEAKAHESLPTDYARLLVREGLETEVRLQIKGTSALVKRQETQIKKLTDELSAAKQEWRQSKIQIANLLQFLTVKAMDVSEKEAVRWIKEHLFAEETEKKK